ncbi:hypothetical protein LEMLEM_LOCUS26946 [Lemmus lemmus]
MIYIPDGPVEQSMEGCRRRTEAGRLTRDTVDPTSKALEHPYRLVRGGAAAMLR